MAAVVSDRTHGLSPPPRSKGLAVAAVTISLLLLAVVTVTSVNIASGISDPGLRLFSRIFGGLSVATCLFVCWRAATAFRSSVKSGHQQAEGNIIPSRVTADLARQESFVTFGLVLTVLIAYGFVQLICMNDGNIQKTFLRFDLMGASLGDIASAFRVNIFIAVASEIIVLVFGLMLAVARMLPGKAGAPLRMLATGYIDLMRAVPAVIVIYLIGFGLPLANIPFLSHLPREIFAILALSLTHSAYVAETYRAGIEAIHPSQWSASRSLGFSFGQTLRFVILPQAVRSVVPPLLSAFIGLQKDTALVNVIGTMDAFNQAKFYASSNFNLSSVSVVAVLFVIITIPQTRLVDWLLKRRNG